MGLDMYLNKKVYVGNQYRKPKQRVKITVPKDQSEVFLPIDKKGINIENLSYLEFNELYWRKANAIHNWFVENVQGGEDDCGEYCVSIDQLEELKTVCENTINHVQSGEKVTVEELENEGLLHPVSGFFFGSSEIDEYFVNKLEYTIEKLTPIVKNKDSLDEYYYRSSW